MRRHSRGLVLALAVPFASALAQKVSLRIQPRVGDTLTLRLDQRVEMRQVTEPAHASGLVSTLTVVTRAIVEHNGARGATVRATTDSVDFTSNVPALSRAAERAQRAVGQQVRLRIAPDGMTAVLESDNGPRPDVQGFFSRMPATLPRDPVRVGTSWKRAMAVPLTPDATASAPGASLQATFRLDSLTRGGSLAWLSIRGTLDRATTVRADLQGAAMELEGDMWGYLLLDRQRGWITDARIDFLVRSSLTPAAAGSRPTVVRMRVSQRMRVR